MLHLLPMRSLDPRYSTLPTAGNVVGATVQPLLAMLMIAIICMKLYMTQPDLTPTGLICPFTKVMAMSQLLLLILQLTVR